MTAGFSPVVFLAMDDLALDIVGMDVVVDNLWFSDVLLALSLQPPDLLLFPLLQPLLLLLALHRPFQVRPIRGKWSLDVF